MTCYTTLEVQNFKGIREMKLEGLGMVNVFVGGNNVGKTSVLQAIYCCHELNKTNLDSEGYMWKIFLYSFLAAYYEEEIVSESIFYKQDKTKMVKALLDTKNLKLSYNTNEIDALLSQSKMYSRFFNDPDQQLRNVLLLENKSEKTLVLEDQPRDSEAIWRSNMINMTRHGIRQRRKPILNFVNTTDKMNSIATVLYEVEQEDYYTQILKPLEKKLSKIRMNQDGIVCFLEDVSHPFRLSIMGDGFVKKLALACLIAKNKGQTLFIDEIENGFHWSVQKDMWRMILTAAKDDGTQFFFTTHSYEVLESLNAVLQEMKDNGESLKVDPKEGDATSDRLDLACVFELEKSTDDVVTYTKYQGLALEGAIINGIEIRGRNNDKN